MTHSTYGADAGRRGNPGIKVHEAHCKIVISVTKVIARIAAEVCVRSLSVFLVARMATEVGVRSLPVFQVAGCRSRC